MDPEQGQEQPTDAAAGAEAPAVSADAPGGDASGAPPDAAPGSEPQEAPATADDPVVPQAHGDGGDGGSTSHGADPSAPPSAPQDAEPSNAAHTEVPSDVPGTNAAAGTDLLPFAGGAAVLAVLGVVAFMATRRSTPAGSSEAPAAPGVGRSDVVDSGKAPAPKGLARFREALSRTRDTFGGGLGRLFGDSFDESELEDLEMLLLSSDVGMPTTQRLLQAVREKVKGGESDAAALKATLLAEMNAILDGVAAPIASAPPDGPLVILVVGVNGSGKTTTIGKLAHRYQEQGKRVLLAAGDTYRAAAAEQLTVWAERTGADIVSHQAGADPGAVVYDALSAAKARGHDVVIVDTAGRLQTRKPLMEQLSKVRRVIQKIAPDGPHETLLVVDGTMGQNALSQARLFDEATPLTGVVVTKLDGTAKGGMVLTIAAELGLAVKLVGIGEQAADLRDFHAGAFVEALT